MMNLETRSMSDRHHLSRRKRLLFKREECALDLPADHKEQGSHRTRFLSFFISKDRYGIDINTVTEIVGVDHITKIPEMPRYIGGKLNIRGMNIPVIDIRLRFGKDAKADDEQSSVIIVDHGDFYVGLIVDSTAEVLIIQDDDILKLPKVSSNAAYSYIKGIWQNDELLVMILDVENLLPKEEFENIRALF